MLMFIVIVLSSLEKGSQDPFSIISYIIVFFAEREEGYAGRRIQRQSLAGEIIFRN